MEIHAFRIVRAVLDLKGMRTGSEEGSHRCGYKRTYASVIGPHIVLGKVMIAVQKTHTQSAGELLSEERHFER